MSVIDRLLVRRDVLLVCVVLGACGESTPTAPPSGLSYPTNPATYTVGVRIAPNAPTYLGGRATSFEVSPHLPEGVRIDPRSGTITGTPASASARARFTVRASNAGGSTSAWLTLEVVDAPPRDLAYRESSPTYTRGLAIVPNLPTHTGGEPASFTVRPPLPLGLGLDPVTGVISGTPEVVAAPARHEVRAVNGSGSSAVVLTIAVSEAAPMRLAYETASAVYTKGRPIAENRPTSAGGIPSLYRASTELPAGLRLDPATGVISGTPLVITPASTYEVRASNAAGGSATLLTIAVNDEAPAGLSYSARSATYPRSLAIAVNRPSSSGGAITSYSVHPELPAGLALDPATGVVSGTPRLLSPATTYVITAANSGGETRAEIEITVVTLAEASRPGITGDQATATPFARWLIVDGTSLDQLHSAGYRIAPRPGTVSRPVSVTYGSRYLRRRGFVPSGRELRLLVSGLYAGASNPVDVLLTYVDGSERMLKVSLEAPTWVDRDGVYGRPTVRTARTAGDDLGFDYVWIKSALGSPVVMDTDGNVRWVAPGMPDSSSSAFLDGAFVVGTSGMNLTRLELDGTTTSVQVNEPRYLNFHHDVGPGKAGLLILPDGTSPSGLPRVETMIAEVAPDGTVLAEWDMTEILAREMREGGDDPADFVREGVDWFHVNSAAYVPEDDSLLVSSRENFVVKLDHSSGAIRWLFGDPTKYWYSFPSLRARALGLASGEYPIGQHSLSWPASGELLLFNNGHASLNNPDGTPEGEELTYSAPARYYVNEASGMAEQIWSFEAGQSIKSPICSSVYEAAPGQYFVTYSMVNGNTAKLVGLQGNRVAFDIELPSRVIRTAWNARPFPFDDLVLME